MRFIFVIALAILSFGCASTEKGMKIIDPKDAQRATWAESKQTFKVGEEGLVRVHGYGGHQVKLELWRVPDRLLGTLNQTVPKASISRSDAGIGFHEYFGEMVPMERERIQWTTKNWIIPFKRLPPGKYAFRLTADDGRKETAAFTVEP